MGTVVIMRGVPGSGKSTTATGIYEYIKDRGDSAIIVSNDLFPGYYENAERSYDWTPEKAKEARKFCEASFEQALKDGYDVVIVDNCHLTPKSYGFYERAAKAAGYEVAFNVFKPVMDEKYISVCASRNKHGVTEAMIRGMINSWRD